VGKQLIKIFEDDLTEGNAMVAQLFKVHPVVGDYRTSTHRFKIGFYQTTFLAKVDDFSNVIGQIVNFGSLENKMIEGKDNMKLLIELCESKINVKMMCTLWDHYAKQVYDHITSYMSTIIICVTRFSSIVLLEWKCIY
ncbi:unnamed protein product, partial [Brassica oleracea]